MPKSNSGFIDEMDFHGSKDLRDQKPITQFFAFLDTTAGLLKSIVNRYLRVSDTAWRAFIALLFILVLWLSGDMQRFIFMGIIGVLGVLILIDIAIDNWGKIFRAFRHEKTFSEINLQSPTSIILTLGHYNVVGKDMIDLLKYLKTSDWVTVRMVDTLLKQQHLDDYAVNELLTAKLNKNDLIRILWHHHNTATDQTLSFIFKKWGFQEDIVKTCLKRQITSIELIRKEKGISREAYSKIEKLCPMKNVNTHWLLKPFRLLFVLFGLGTTYFLFLMQQNDSLNAITTDAVPPSAEAITTLFLTNLVVALLVSIVLWAVVYALTLPILKFTYYKLKDFEFNQAYKETFE